MISHAETVNIWLGAFGTAAFIGGLLSGHWWWPLRQRLDEEWDDGYETASYERYWVGYSIGVGDQANGVAWMYDEYGENLPPNFREVMPSEAVPEHRPVESVPRPGQDVEGSPPSSITGPGRTYSELVMLAAQDTPGPLDDALTAPVDPGWFPDALRRSEDWLGACRAELGLVAS